MSTESTAATAIVIPSRYSSTRFPGKPLALIAGKSLLNRVWDIARAAAAESDVFIATDDARIVEHARSFGAQVLLTSAACRNGTERVHEALGQLKRPAQVIVNLQGDAVLTPPGILRTLIATMQSSPETQIGTPAVRLTIAQLREAVAARTRGESTGTFVVFDRDHRALYFSKSPIPHFRKLDADPIPLFKHIGIYAYRPDALAHLVRLAPTPLENAEQLEQLRALENGISIKVVEVSYEGRTAWSVDAPEDIGYVEEILRREGEILPAV